MVFNKIDDGETPAEKSDERMEFLMENLYNLSDHGAMQSEIWSK